MIIRLINQNQLSLIYFKKAIELLLIIQLYILNWD